MKELLKFKYENVEYVVFIKNNKFIYKKILSNEYVDVIDKEERLIIDQVIRQIIPTDKIFDLGEVNVRGKIFRNYVDSKGYNIFYEVIENTLKLPDEEDIIYFNQVFNNKEEFISSNEQNKKNDNKYFKKLVKIGGVLSIVLVVASITFNIHTKTIHVEDEIIDYNDIVQEIEITNEKEEIKKNLNEHNIIKLNGIDYVVNSKEIVTPSVIKINTTNNAIDIEDEFNANKIINLINNNDKLTTEEKDRFTSSSIYFEDNYKYMNEEAIIKQMNELDVIYNKDKSNDNVAGKYFISGINKYEIHIYDSEFLNEKNEKVATHEMIHAHTDFSKETIGRSFIEGLTTMFNFEYFNGDYNLYKGSVQRCKLLAEIIGTEPLRKYLFNPDIDIIIDELEKIIPDRNLAIILINYSDTAHNYENKKMDLDDDLQNKYADDYNKYFNNIIIKYYEAKYNKSYDSNLRLFYTIKPNEARDALLKYNNLTEEEMIDATLTFEFTSKRHYYFNSNKINNIQINDNNMIKFGYLQKQQSIDYISIGDAYIMGYITYADDKFISTDSNLYTIIDDKKVEVISYENEFRTFEVENDILSLEQILKR